MAEDAARKMSNAAFKDRIEKAESEYETAIERMIGKYVPSPIINVTAEYKNHIETYPRLSFTNGGGNYLYCSTLRPIPRTHPFQVSSDDFNELKCLKRKLDNIKAERNKYEYDVCSALFNSLRTEKRIMESFPEALQYMNFPGTTDIVPDFSNLRSMLKG